MAVRYETFAAIPVNRNARKRHFRAARLGTRPTPSTPNIGDALRTVSAVAAFKSEWESSGVEPARTVRTAYASATDLVPWDPENP